MNKKQMIYEDTIKDAAFLTHLLLENEELENKVLVNTYKGFELPKERSMFEAGNLICKKIISYLVDQELICLGQQEADREDFDDNISSSQRIIVDNLLYEYYRLKYKSYYIDQNRKQYLRKKIF